MTFSWRRDVLPHVRFSGSRHAEACPSGRFAGSTQNIRSSSAWREAQPRNHYFVTTCAVKRRTILAALDVHNAIVGTWRKASTWLVGRYVVMPDHIHLFCRAKWVDVPSLERWMRYWKSIVTKSIGAKSGEVWQRHHWTGSFVRRTVTLKNGSMSAEIRCVRLLQGSG